MKIPTSQRLQNFFAQFEHDDHVLVVISADPDAIASAMAVKRLLWRRVAQVTITHTNDIGREDNLTMIRLLKINLMPVDHVERTRFSKTVMVDSQPNHSNALQAFAPDVLIDHHPDTGYDAPFRDIRPTYGATASILTEYLRAARIKPSSRLASGLFYAIKTDTNNFQRKALIEDVRAFQFLFRHANTHLIQKIEQSELRFDLLKYFKLGIERMRRRKTKVFSHLGRVANPDVVVMLADFFMRISAVSWSIVSCYHDKRLIIIFRCDGIRKNAGKLAHQTFGEFGTAGGHRNMARAEIARSEIKDVVDCRDDARLARWVRRRVERKVTESPKKETNRGPTA